MENSNNNVNALADSIASWYKKLFSMTEDERLKAIDSYINEEAEEPATDEEVEMLKRYMTHNDEDTVKSIDTLSSEMQVKLANLSLGLAAYVNGKSAKGLKWTS